MLKKYFLIHFSHLKVENTPTLGSLETSDIEKQSLARRSLEFNINDNIFCDLFPDLATVSKLEFEFGCLLTSLHHILKNVNFPECSH